MSSSTKVFSRVMVNARRAAGRRLQQQATFVQQKRNAAGIHPPDQTKAYLFGRGPGHKPEGWEGIMLATWIASAAVLFVGVGMGPQTSIKVTVVLDFDEASHGPSSMTQRPVFAPFPLNYSAQEWARDEALARDIREAKGQPVEYGKIYSQERMFSFKPGSDDDEEDEEEEE